MKEIFEKLPHIAHTSEDAKQIILLDTCFFIHTFEHQKEHELKLLMNRYKVAMTSFNVEEFLFNEHRVDERVREYARKFLKKYPEFTVITIPVSPGNREAEKEFVHSVDPTLLQKVPDASDAVLMATGIVTQSTILTKDKHHLFTTKLENYLQKYDLAVYKEYHDIE
ncbi:MAG: PIN domain-containing protein [Candidatus Woesearchaeota archaeon]